MTNDSMHFHLCGNIAFSSHSLLLRVNESCGDHKG